MQLREAGEHSVKVLFYAFKMLVTKIPQLMFFNLIE